MGDKATLRMARQELEDLYLGVPDDSVDLTFKDLPEPSAVSFSAAATPATDGIGGDESKKKQVALVRSSTNIFTYKVDDDDSQAGGGKRAVHYGDHAGLELPPPLMSPPPPHQQHHHHQNGRRPRRPAAGDEQQRNKLQDPPIITATAGSSRANYKRPGIPHSNICALCSSYVYFFRHRCLVCGRVYCRQCVGAGMGEMTEGRKCIDCLGRRYSHRYIHRAGASLNAAGGCCCFWPWGYYPNAKVVKAQELLWAEKGPAPRRHPRPSSSSTSSSTSTSISTSYGGSYSASMSMTMSSNNNMTVMMNGGSSTSGLLAPQAAASTSSFVAAFSPNPYAFPL